MGAGSVKDENGNPAFPGLDGADYIVGRHRG